MRSPFRFLDSYSLKDKDAFFGRKKETDVFYEMVNKNRLLLVYGQSGSGKTSLVECGLANRFDVTDWYPIRVRRRQNINASLRESLQAVLKEGDEDEEYDLPETLTEQIEDIYAEYLRPVYLIFDQLEEVFILGDEAEQEQFIQSIAELFHSKIACRVIFILREEYLGHLYDFEKVIPTLFDRRLRVEVMNNTKVQTVLQKSFAKFNISLEAPAEDRLREMIANISGGKSLIQLPYLQVYLDMLYREDYQRTYGDKERGDELPPLEFTQTEIAKFGQIEEVLSKFLDFQEKEIQSILSAKYPALLEHTVLQIMDAYVTDEGTKRPLAYTRIDGLVTVDEKVKRLFPPVSDEILSDCFIELEKARIIRMLDDYMELAHDSLAALLTNKRGAEQQLRKRLSAALQEYELSGGKQLLAETQLLGMAEMLPKLYLDEATQLLIEKSKYAVAEQKDKEKIATAQELAKQREQAAKEKRLREVAETSAVRAKRVAIFAILISLFAVFSTNFAYNQYSSGLIKQTKAEKLTSTILANELCDKAQNLLDKGDRTTAFQLASFAYQIVDTNDNKKAASVVSDAYYIRDVEIAADTQKIHLNRKFTGHSSYISSVAFSLDGQYTLTGSSDSTAKLWNRETGLVLQTYTGHKGEVISAIFSPDGRFVATASEDGYAKIWETESSQAIHTFVGHQGEVNSVAFSPDGKYLLTGGADATVKLWEVSTGQLIRTINKHKSEVLSVAFSPDGTKLLTGSWDKTAKIWDRKNGTLLKTLGHTDKVEAVAFSPDSRHIVTGSSDDLAFIWSVKSGRKTGVFKGHTDDISSVAFSPDNTKILTASWDGIAKIWDIKNEKNSLVSFNHHSNISAAAFSPDGQYLLTGGLDKIAKLWDINNQSTFPNYTHHNKRISGVAYTSDGQYLLTSSWDKTAKLLNWETGEVLQTFKADTAVSSLSISSDNQFLLTGYFDHTAKLWNIQNGQEIGSFKGHTSDIIAVDFSPDGEKVLTGSFDGTIKLWNTTDNSIIKTFKGHTDEVSSVSFSSDGQYIVSGSWDKTAKLWNVKTGLEIRNFSGHKSEISSVCFSPGVPSILTSSYDGTIKLWDYKDGTLIHTFKGNMGKVSSVSFSPDGQYIAAGGLNNKVQSWTLNTEKIINQQFINFPNGGITTEELSENDILKLLQILPNGWEKVLNNANYQILGSIAESLVIEGQKDNDSIYFNFFPLAEKLYKAANNKSTQAVFSCQLANLNFLWSQKLQKNQDTNLALSKAASAYKLSPQIEYLLYLYELSIKENRDSYFKQLTNRTHKNDIEITGNYFYQKQEWEKAKQFYDKRVKIGKEQKEPILGLIPTLVHLQNIAQKLGTKFSFDSFLQNESMEQLNTYLTYFRYQTIDFNKKKKNLKNFEFLYSIMNHITTRENEEFDSEKFAINANNYAYFQILNGDFIGAEASARRGLEFDSTIPSLRIKIPMALLLQNNKFEAAEIEFKKWANQPYSVKNSPYTIFAEKILADFERLEKEKIIPEANRIKVQEIKDYLQKVVQANLN